MNLPAKVVQNPSLKPRPPRLRLRLRTPPARQPAPPVEATGTKRKMCSSRADLSSTEPRELTAAVVTVSDSCARGERNDLSGPAVPEDLRQVHFSVTVTEVVPDYPIPIQQVLIRMAREVRLVVTTGGTGIAPRDVTPEATI